MIFVLPILLYPILGIGVIKFAMALEQKPRAGGRRGGRVPAQAAALLEFERRRLQSGPFRHARRGRADRRAPGTSDAAPGATTMCASGPSAMATSRR